VEAGIIVTLVTQVEVDKPGRSNRKKRKKVKTYTEQTVFFDPTKHNIHDIRYRQFIPDRHAKVQDIVTINIVFEHLLSFFNAQVCWGAAVNDDRKQLSFNAQHARQLRSGSTPAATHSFERFQRDFRNDTVSYC
jgi:hypothetical protein